MNKTIKITLFLAVVAFLSGLSIGVVNSFTAPIISENAIAAEKVNLEKIFPSSKFETIDYQSEDGTILGAYKVLNKGFIFKATANGYKPSIVCLIGMDEQGTIVDIAVLEHQETKGIGSKCFDDENIQKLYVGKTVSEEVDVLSGATFTSNAMKKMIAAAQNAYSEVK